MPAVPPVSMNRFTNAGTVALRVRFPPLEDSDLVMRILADSPQRLVAAPQWLDGRAAPSDPAELTGAPSLDWGPARHHVWQLVGPNGEHAQLRHHPRFITDDMHALRDAAIHGVGIVQLPCMVVEDDLRNGTLVDVLPGWAPKGGVVHAVFPSRRGLLPRVRLLIDFLAEHIRKD
ncbi:LysR family transcriptional regulator [Burkholderia stabilis]|nr:LysR family transcriptional regulator [Burkholderia stabilis]